jgi:hypothetical protein
LYALANSILAEYKHVAPLSDLDTAICLFRDALDQRQVPHPHRMDSLNDLAGALITRLLHTGHLQDLHESISLCSEVLELQLSIMETRSVQPQPIVRIHLVECDIWFTVFQRQIKLHCSMM